MSTPADARAAGAPTTDAGRRAELVCDPDAGSVTLGGRTFCNIDPAAVRILDLIHSAGRPVSSTRLRREPGLKGKRIDRCLKKLPDPIRQLVRSRPGRGYWIGLPADRPAGEDMDQSSP